LDNRCASHSIMTAASLPARHETPATASRRTARDCTTT
jgi:hypothetical protein